MAQPTLTALLSVSNCSLLSPSIFPFPLPFTDKVEAANGVEPKTSSGIRKLALLPRPFTLPAFGGCGFFVISFPRFRDDSSVSGSLCLELAARCDCPVFFPKITSGGFRGVGSSGLGSLITGGGIEGAGTILLATNDISGGGVEDCVEEATGA